MKSKITNQYRKVASHEISDIHGGNTSVPPWIFAAIPLILDHWNDIKSGFVDGYRDYNK